MSTKFYSVAPVAAALATVCLLIAGCGASQVGLEDASLADQSLSSDIDALPQDPFVVKSLDLSRYIGLWYEYASVPTPQSGFCINTTAEYSANEDGTIKIVNSCRAGRFPGFPVRIEGTARVVDTQSNAILAVSLGLIPREADYRVIAIDEDNYSYALVTNEKRTSLFILSREKSLDDGIYQSLLSRAKDAGVDVSKVKLTRRED